MLKRTAAGAGIAGVVWSAPRVEGLSLRPSYAAAGSAASSSVQVSLSAVNVRFSNDHPLGGGTVGVSGEAVGIPISAGSSRVSMFVRISEYNGTGTATLQMPLAVDGGGWVAGNTQNSVFVIGNSGFWPFPIPSLRFTINCA